ncbi:hypothetical protein Aros01_07046 [Streptosporangium roseum]
MAGLVLAGCGGSGDAGLTGAVETGGTGRTGAVETGGGSAGGLRQVMAHLGAGSPAADYLDYGDMAHWRSLGVVTEDGPGQDRRWLSAVGSGFGDFGLNASRLAEPTGINVFAADRGVSVGTPPRTAIRIEGRLDSAGIRAKLTALGARPRTIGGQEGLSMADDNAIDMKGPQTRLGLINQLNQVVVTDSALVSGAAAAPVAATLGGGPSLADSPDHAAVADCLGDVVTAVVMAPPQPGGVTLYGVGLRRPAGTTDRAVDVVCVLPRVAEVGRTFAERFTVAAKAGGRPLSDLVETVTHDEVRSGGRTAHRATLTIKPDGPIMLSHQLLFRNELAALADPSAPADPLGIVRPTP